MGVRAVIYVLLSAVSDDMYIDNEPFILIDIEAPLETDHLFDIGNKKQHPQSISGCKTIQQL